MLRFSQLQRLKPTTGNPCVGVYEILNVKVGETIDVIEGVGAAIDVFKLGVWVRTRTTSISILGDVKVVGTLSGHWSRWRDEELLGYWL